MNKFIKITGKERTIWLSTDEIACVIKDEESRGALIVLKHEALGVHFSYNKIIGISPVDYEKIIKMLAL